jgi:trigger factor
LKIDSERLEDHQVKLTVEFDDDTFESAKRRAARQIAKRTKIPGFRPGKAPYHIILRSVGEQAVNERAMELLIDDQYSNVIEEAEIDPYGPGQLENIVSMEPLVLEFIIPLAAKVELGDYRSVRIPYELKEIDDSDIEEVLDNLRQSQAIEEPAERPAQEGDRVFLLLSGKRAVLEEGKEETVIHERQHSVVIQPEDPEDSMEWPYPGFSREIIELSTDDEKSFTYSYPEDSNYENLAGVPVEFHVQVQEIKSRSLPELDEEFVQSVGEFESLSELKEEIKTNLEQQSKDSYDKEYDDDLMTQIVDLSTIEYPPQMLEEEIKVVVRRLENQLKAQNLDLETYLLTQGMSEEEFREDTKPVAEARLNRTLVLLEISEVEDIQLDEQRLQTETERTLNVMTQYMSSSDKRKLSDDGVLANLAGNIAAEMAINQTLEFLRSMAKGELVEAEDSEGSDEPEDQEIKGDEDQQVDPDVDTLEDKEEGSECDEVDLDVVDITDEEILHSDEITEDASVEDASTQEEDN